ncbi:MAG: hypothetical protein ACREAZ_09450 [Nitrososphaera sp.]
MKDQYTTHRALSDDDFAVWHNPKAKAYKRLPNGFHVVEEAPETVVAVCSSVGRTRATAVVNLNEP